MILCEDITDVSGGGVKAREGCPPLEGHQTLGRERNQTSKIRNNKRQSLGSVGVTVRGWNSTTSYFGHTPQTGVWKHTQTQTHRHTDTQTHTTV